jgi:hypothetical protein
MRKAVSFLAAAILCGAGSHAQPIASAPQTPRQALMEMFFSKTPGTLVKHLPGAMREALEKSGAMAKLQAYSLMASQFHAQGQNLQTFETGPVLLTTEDPKTGQKVQVMVENDAMHGDLDDIELSFQIYKNGQAQRTPFMPQLTFSMKQEAQFWTLNEVSVTIHLPLADPDLLKAFTEGMKAGSATSTASPASATFTPQNESPVQPAGTDAMVLAAIRTILTAEVTYASSYPRVGFTCALSSLDGFGGEEPNERQAMLINSGLASGKKYGFVFTLSGCSGAPAATFRLTAVPNGAFYGRKAFCADQSGVIRSSDDGNAATCLASGVPVQ